MEPVETYEELRVRYNELMADFEYLAEHYVDVIGGDVFDADIEKAYAILEKYGIDQGY